MRLDTFANSPPLSPAKPIRPPKPLGFAMLQKQDGEVYVFTWHDDERCRNNVLRLAGRFASDSELSFTWTDASRMAMRVRNLAASNQATRTTQIGG